MKKVYLCKVMRGGFGFGLKEYNFDYIVYWTSEIIILLEVIEVRY